MRVGFGHDLPHTKLHKVEGFQRFLGGAADVCGDGAPDLERTAKSRHRDTAH